MTGSPAQATPITLLIIEFDYHAGVLREVCSLLKSDFRLIVLSTEAIWQKTGLSSGDVHAVALKTAKESYADFFKRHAGLVATADLVYFNTLQRPRRFFLHYWFDQPTVLRIHNAHAELAPWQHIAWSLRDLRRITGFLLGKVLLQRRWHHKKLIVDRCTRLMFPNSAIAEYVAAQGWVARHKIASYSLPFTCLPQPAAEPVRAGPEVVMAVLGSVTPKRKSYEVLYEALQRARVNFRKPVELLFLGECRDDAGRKIIAQFDGLSAGNFKFRASAGYVSAEQMKLTMARVNFLVAPIQTVSRFQIQREIYGRSKISGAEIDVISYRKPALITAGYRLPDELAPVCDSFTDAADLASRLEQWINEDLWVAKAAGFATLDAYMPATILAQFGAFARELSRDG